MADNGSVVQPIIEIWCVFLSILVRSRYCVASLIYHSIDYINFQHDAGKECLSSGVNRTYGHIAESARKWVQIPPYISGNILGFIHLSLIFLSHIKKVKIWTRLSYQ